MIYVLIHYTKSWQPLADIVVPNADEYCRRHGYTLDVICVEDYQKYTGIEKLSQIQEVLKDWDVAMVMDCDSLITNHNITIEQFLDNQHAMYVSRGVNMGVFIIRMSGWSNIFLSWVVKNINNRTYHCEQDATIGYMDKFAAPFKISTHPAFNSYMSELYPEIPQPVTEEQGQWVAGKSFVLHLPGLGMEKRLEILKSTPITK